MFKAINDAVTGVKYRTPIRRGLRRGEVVFVRREDRPYVRGTFQGYGAPGQLAGESWCYVATPDGRVRIRRDCIVSRRDRLEPGSLIWVGPRHDRWRGVVIGYTADGTVVYYRSGDQRDRRGSNSTDSGAEFIRPEHVTPRDFSECHHANRDSEIIASGV